jgi:hypothetical protein
LLVRVGDLNDAANELEAKKPKAAEGEGEAMQEDDDRGVLDLISERLEALVDALEAEFKDYGGFIAHFIIICAAQLPLQAPVYATLTGLLNARSEEMGGKVVRESASLLESMLQSGRWVNAKCLVRFLVELANARVIRSEGAGSMGALLEALASDALLASLCVVCSVRRLKPVLGR